MSLKQKVYLSGGMKTDWASKIKERLVGFEFFNPKTKEMKSPMYLWQAAVWDLHFIKNCDIVFVYVERTNKSCIGLSCEAGYAKGLGKTVITVLETGHETISDDSLRFIASVSDVVFPDIESGIEYLKHFNI